MKHVLIALALAATLSVAVDAKDPALAPLSIARQGYFFVGGKYSTVKDQQVMSGQLYVEFQIPSKQTHEWPIVMIHGGGQSGTNFTGTPDGREGWAQYFLRQGYAVYIVDQPGRGRAAYLADLYDGVTPPALDNVQRRFVAPERYRLWPQARLHTQWPGTGAPGDAVFDQFYASQLPSIQDFTLQQVLNRDAIVALLDRIGPVIVLTHSQSGAFGWPVADRRPDFVKAIVAVEPNGPPFFDVTNVPAPEWFRDSATQTRPWGVTAVPLSRKQYIGPGNPSAGKTRCARPHEVLVAEIARSATAQSAEDTDFNYDGGSFLPCSLRSLHGEIPRAGRCSFHMDQAGGYWYSR